MTDKENTKNPSGEIPNSTPNTTPTDQRAKSSEKTLASQIKNILKKFLTLSKNLFCLTIWIWLVYRVIGEPFPFAGFFQFVSSLISPYYLAIKIGVLALIISLIVFKKVFAATKFIFFLWIRLIFFPLVLLYYIFYVPFKTTKLTLWSVNIFFNKLVRTSITRAAILLVILLPSSLLITLLSENIYFLVFSLILSMLGLVITLRVAFRWTAKPLILLEESLATYYKVLDFFVNQNISQVKENPENPQKEFETRAKQFELCHKSLNWIERFVERTTDRKIIIKYFFILFAICFMFTVLTFSLVYLTLSKIEPQAFLGSQNWTPFDFLYTSLLVIITSGEVSPIWIWAKIAVALEIIFGICLLSLLIFHFSMVSIPEVLDRKESVLGSIRDKKSDVKNQEDIVKIKLLGKPVEGAEFEQK